MQVPQLLNNKMSLGLVGLALTAGIVIGGTNISHKVYVQKASSVSATDPNTTTPNDTSTIVPVVSGSDIAAPATDTAPSANTSTAAPISSSAPSISPQNIPTTQPAAPVQAPAPVTLVDQSKYTRENGERTEVYCHQTYSDGSTREVFAGAGPTDQYNRGDIGFVCPS